MTIALCLMASPATLEAGIREGKVQVAWGLFSFNQKVFRDIYSQIPAYSATLELYFSRNFGLSSGLVVLNRKAQAVGLGEDEDDFPVIFRKIEVPLFLKYRWKWNRLSFSPGLGLCFSSYQEKWETLPLITSGSTIRSGCELNLEYLLGSKVALRLGFKGVSISTGKKSILLNNNEAKLSGWTVSLGLVYDFIKL